MSKTNPTLLGYQSVRLGSSQDQVEASRRAIQEYAERESYALETVYTDVNGDGRGLGALLARVRLGTISAVAVAHEGDLGLTPRFRRYVREALEEAGARVLVVARDSHLASLPADAWAGRA